jgi:hypothetical protein
MGEQKENNNISVCCNASFEKALIRGPSPESGKATIFGIVSE